MMQDFKNLQVWHKAHQLTLEIYRTTQKFPDNEKFGLISQLRRASSSIGANIAEGCGRRGNPELVRFLQIAMGSASEVQYHLLLSRDLGFASTEEYSSLDSQIVEIKRMLASLATHLRMSKLTS